MAASKARSPCVGACGGLWENSGGVFSPRIHSEILAGDVHSAVVEQHLGIMFRTGVSFRAKKGE